MQVMQGVQARTQYLVGTIQVMQVGPGVVAAGITMAIRVCCRSAVAVFGIADANHARAGKQLAIARVAGGHDAIEHIHPAPHRLHQVLRGTDPHQVAGPVHWHLRGGELQDRAHLVHRFTHGQTADGVSVKIHFPQSRKGLGAQRRIHATLDDPEQCRGMITMPVQTAPRPAQ